MVSSAIDPGRLVDLNWISSDGLQRSRAKQMVHMVRLKQTNATGTASVETSLVAGLVWGFHSGELELADTRNCCGRSEYN